jgi:flagellar basal body-associated protein FliL
MTKARKAPQKKQKKRGTKEWASIILLVIGTLVALSMVVTSIFTQNPQVQAQQPTAAPTVVVTPNP